MMRYLKDLIKHYASYTQGLNSEEEHAMFNRIHVQFR